MDKSNDRHIVLTEKNIKEELIGFKEMKSAGFAILNPGMACRYWKKTENGKKFKSGGILLSVDLKGGFLRIKNPDSTTPWIVQFDDVLTLYYKNINKNNQHIFEIADTILKLNMKYHVTLQHYEDLLNVFCNKDDVDHNLDIIFNKYDANIENVFKENLRLKRENITLKQKNEQFTNNSDVEEMHHNA
jgi:hypothetical protein